MERAGRGRGLEPRPLATARPLPTRTIWPGGGRGGVGVTRGRRPQTSEVWLPRRDRAHAGPLGTRAVFQAELDSGSSQDRTPSTPLFHSGECGLPSLRFGGPCFCHSACPGAGVFIPSLQMLLRGAFSPAKIEGFRRWVFASLRYPDVASPFAPQMTGEGVSNLSFRTCIWGVSFLPSASSLMFWERESHFPFAQPL